MSVLDRAFIRAFNKGTSAEDTNAAESARAESDTDTTDREPPVESADHLINAMCGGQVYRIDQAQPTWTSKFPQPHIQLIPAGTGADLAFASPYHEICPPAFPDLAQAPEMERESQGTLPTSEEGPEAASEALDETAEQVPADRDEPGPDTKVDSEPAPAEPPTTVDADPAESVADAASSLRDAASLKMPSTLPLPEVFQLPTEEQEEQPQADEATTFSPDWEVDRFVWPEICKELIEVQSRYFEHVGSRLLAATAESDHAIMISGSRRGEGRSTLAMCLARCAADAGINVALVDADLENPRLGARLGLETPCSWLEAVATHRSLREAAVTSVEDRLTLFPLTGKESVDIQPGDGRLIMFVRRISAHYPLVIIDTGPLGPEQTHLFESEAACPIDTAIVVRDLRGTDEQGALATAERLQLGGIQAVGIAENFRATE
jgi:Mrp family chromosome partitioning ATPase